MGDVQAVKAVWSRGTGLHEPPTELLLGWRRQRIKANNRASNRVVRWRKSQPLTDRVKHHQFRETLRVDRLLLGSEIGLGALALALAVGSGQYPAAHSAQETLQQEPAVRGDRSVLCQLVPKETPQGTDGVEGIHEKSEPSTGSRGVSGSGNLAASTPIARRQRAPFPTHAQARPTGHPTAQKGVDRTPGLKTRPLPWSNSPQ